MNPAQIRLSLTYGILLIGVLVATLFQGILTIQAYYYYEDFPDDPRNTKIFVAVLWTLDFIHLILISYTVYYYLVSHWGSTSVLLELIPQFRFHMFPISFTVLLSQLFLLHRIWILSQRNVWVVGPVFVCILGNFGLICTMGALLMANVGFPQGLVPMVFVGTFTDILIAALMCYYIRKRSEGSRNMRVTRALATQVIRYAVATGSFTSFLILGCLFAFLAAPFTYTYIAFNFSSGRTYSNAVLVNLNARRKFREALQNMGRMKRPSFVKSTELGGSSSVTRRIPRLASSVDGRSYYVQPTRPQSIARDIGFGSQTQFPADTHSGRLRRSLP